MQPAMAVDFLYVIWQADGPVAGGGIVVGRGHDTSMLATRHSIIQ